MNGVDLEVAIDQLPHHGELGELSLDSGESGPYIICENQHVFQRAFVSQETHKKIKCQYLGSKAVQQLYYSFVHYHLLLSQQSQVLRDRILATTFSPLQKEHVDFRLPC